MGAWGVLAFDNDEANDWAHGLAEVDDLSLVEAAFEAVELVGDGYLDSHESCDALAACEVIARLRGRPGYHNAHTEKVDAWVAAHPQRTPPTLIARASAVIDRILARRSELRDLWADAPEHGDAWQRAVEDLRARMSS